MISSDITTYHTWFSWSEDQWWKTFYIIDYFFLFFFIQIRIYDPYVLGMVFTKRLLNSIYTFWPTLYQHSAPLLMQNEFMKLLSVDCVVQKVLIKAFYNDYWATNCQQVAHNGNKGVP